MNWRFQPPFRLAFASRYPLPENAVQSNLVKPSLLALRYCSISVPTLYYGRVMRKDYPTSSYVGARARAHILKVRK